MGPMVPCACPALLGLGALCSMGGPLHWQFNPSGPSSQSFAPNLHLIAHGVACSILSRPITVRRGKKKRDRGRQPEHGQLTGRCCIHQHHAADGKAWQKARPGAVLLCFALLAIRPLVLRASPSFFSAPRPSSTRPHAAFLPQPAPVRRRQSPSFEPPSASLQLAFHTRSSLSTQLDCFRSALLFSSIPGVSVLD
ncbi:hypothetical protein HDV57DRAFT_443929 [Trichoderma longibrachiatum]|uniref:Secreted protein n=1 Tax=Trichoderma longibrachiatum ATCC 18648 TaxID=983965 RepID=A0A2T4CG37_TRILO|nr:hypothetical protein M440DRAFT_1128239 [Trichoderma longibrachiatum ATCC 18648]